ncbi:MAG: DUF2807 domain-containing protein [Bacteroidales bacterium]|nr:DUF2807 domain-containing protein [Bacteroidales bacterium]
MKIQKLHSFIFLVTLLFSLPLSAQEKGSGPISKQERQVGVFTAIKTGGAAEVILMQGGEQGVVVETNANIQDRVEVFVREKTLQMKLNNVKNYSVLKLYITVAQLEKIQVSGASDVKSIDTLRGESLRLVASGASDLQLLVNYNNISTKASGASVVRLKGKSAAHSIEASGASVVKAKLLSTTTTVVKASGASSCFVNAKTNLTYQVSGSSDVSYVNKPQTVIVENKKGTEKVVIIRDSTHTSNYYNDNDTTSVNVGSLHVEVVEGDTTKVTVGSHTLIVDDDGNVKWERSRKPRFNGHWGGFELGINGYVTPGIHTNWGVENDFLNLRYEKSIAVNLNIYEQNIALNKDKNIGLVTGIGLAWNNYRFNQPTYLEPLSSNIEGYYMEGVSVRKTKLTAMYITVPLLFEMQTKNPKRIKRFFFSVGGLISARISSHTKIYFNEAAKAYKLRVPDSDPAEYKPGTYVTPNIYDRNIVKSFRSFYLQPVKLDASLRIGYGILSIFGTYSLNTFFQSNRGPKLYAWTIGITLVGW